MEPGAAFVVGALVAAAKGLGLAAIGAGIAWWRARRRVRELEAQLAAAAQVEQDTHLAQLEQGLDYLTRQLTELADQQQAILRRLPRGHDAGDSHGGSDG
ncbi:MAG TPA: hypothetical protein VJ847_12165 [Gemmatimonadales bacterium]|jgi:hypothetical protein|nr:hypothetical protein [Gemmatimonadales bacterium]